MRHHIVDTPIHMRNVALNPKEILINILEDEGDDLGWEEDLLICEALSHLNEESELAREKLRAALDKLLEDGLVVRHLRLICLNE